MSLFLQVINLASLPNISIAKLTLKMQKNFWRRNSCLGLWQSSIIVAKASSFDTGNSTASTWPVKQLARLKVILDEIFTLGIKSHIFDSVTKSFTSFS